MLQLNRTIDLNSFVFDNLSLIETIEAGSLCRPLLTVDVGFSVSR
jgi:hypothetical protein